MIGFKFENQAHVRRGLRQVMERDLPTRVQRGVDEVMDGIYQESQARVPVVTGRLKRSGRRVGAWHGRGSRTVSGGVEYSAPYASRINRRREFLPDPDDSRQREKVRRKLQAAIGVVVK